tara:strand:+ start:370 stop:726 length:357 start_codon:yes stop_codon:yes gene_type:complete
MIKLLFLLFISLIFNQEVCEGTCLSDEESKNLYNNIQELQFNVSKYVEIEKNLNQQIQTYVKSDSLYQLQIIDYKKQLEMKEEMINLVKPKWHENKYLWFFGGVIITSGSVFLAGQIK